MDVLVFEWISDYSPLVNAVNKEYQVLAINSLSELAC